MAYKPILFQSLLVQRILTGHKTQTRRITDARKMLLGKKYCEVGDVLWVRETFWTFNNVTVYKADNPHGSAVAKKWKPSIFMPKDRCRLWLKVKSVHVEELDKISEADAIKEGVEKDKYFIGGYKAYTKSSYTYCKDAIGSFFTLWDSINGKDSLEKNPFVWVIEFEKCEMPHDFLTV